MIRLAPLQAAVMSSTMANHPRLRCSHVPTFGLLMILLLLVSPAAAVLLDFQNCLSDSFLRTTPQQLQWVPLHVDVVFDRSHPSHNLHITFYGNVTGRQYQWPIPPYTDQEYWSNPQQLNGKIVRDVNGTLSTLFQRYNFLNYLPYAAPALNFCDQVSGNNTRCPISPVFNSSTADLPALRQFSVSNDLNASYALASLATTVSFLSADKGPDDKGLSLGCISVIVTPDLGSTLTDVFTYVPIVILVAVAAAVIIAAMWSPWGSNNVFHWTSNWGRDQDILRLVTPGFGDCLMYLQFIVLAGSLSLDYPGFFQPVVSNVAWSALMFNQSFVSDVPGTANPVDGVYVTHGKYGLERMSQLVGLSESKDIWTGAVIWTLVILAAVIMFCQIGFVVRWALQKILNTPAEDLRSKNWPFTGGILVRVVCNFFLLPIVSYSMFQLLISTQSPIYVTVLAVILLVLILAFAGLILRVVLTTKPRSKLFDDLSTVLLYGPLYNTYSDNEAPFAWVPALLTFIRGVAIGAVQPSGVAQVVILAICEVMLILTLLAFRPFHRPTSMNAYHIFFASFRLATVLLCVAFIPSLGVTEGPKGWIGYAILVMHGIVLIFGFFLNAVQRLIEVMARIMGAGGDEGSGAATRGGLHVVFGMRQLSRRARRPGFRKSMHSDAAAVLTDDLDAKTTQYGGRSRSISASSAILLNSRVTPSDRRSLSTPLGQMESRDTHDDLSTPIERQPYDFFDDAEIAAGRSHKPGLSIGTNFAADPYYRAPRQRRLTSDMMTPGAKSRASWVNAEHQGQYEPGSPESQAAGGMESSRSGHQLSMSADSKAMVPSPAILRDRDASDQDPSRTNVDYAVREVDFYYGVRGPALNAQPTRKLKTGPADPVGPVSSATGWFKNMFNRKTKDSGKGFEVVRSTRALPNGGYPDPVSSSPPPQGHEPYSDNPSGQKNVDPTAIPGVKTRSSRDSRSFDGDISDERVRARAPSPMNSDDETFDNKDDDREVLERVSRDEGSRHERLVSAEAPSLGTGAMDLGSFSVHPSRFNSRASTTYNNLPDRHPNQHQQGFVEGAGGPSRIPTIPRRSSKRRSLSGEKNELFSVPQAPRLSTVLDSPAPILTSRSGTPAGSSNRVPFSDSRRSLGAESALSIDNLSDNDAVGHESSEDKGFPLSQLPPNWPLGGPGPTEHLSHGHSMSTSTAGGESSSNMSLGPTNTVRSVHAYRASDAVRHHGGAPASGSAGSRAEVLGGDEDEPRR